MPHPSVKGTEGKQRDTKGVDIIAPINFSSSLISRNYDASILLP